MGWRALLQKKDETIVSPWVGGRYVRTNTRTWTIEGQLPAEHGWHEFNVKGRKARHMTKTETPFGVLRDVVQGYLVGDRMVPDSVAVAPNIAELARNFERAHLIEAGLGRFTRISAGRSCEAGPLLFECEQMPLGPEEEVQAAYLDRRESLAAIAGVSPALDAAFRLESHRREQVERRRRQAHERHQRELERLHRERLQRELVEELGDACTRRRVAATDFEAAARAALAVGNAELLDHRRAYTPDEMVVQFRLAHRSFECSCHRYTLRIIDAGICLEDHDTGRKDDSLLTLESLPAVIMEAEQRGLLVVFRTID